VYAYVYLYVYEYEYEYEYALVHACLYVYITYKGMTGEPLGFFGDIRSYLGYMPKRCSYL
jgi:hypothetical protein